MPRETSLERRVAWGSALGASIAALLAAFATSALGAFLILAAEDRRLQEAAVILAALIDDSPGSVPAVVEHEKEENVHSGILLVAFHEDGRYVAGDRHVGMPATERCIDDAYAPVRVCRSSARHGLVAVAASPRSEAVPILGLAALAAGVLAGVLALLASSPVARWLVAPLSRLRSRIAAIDVATGLPESLGEPERVLEVDALRDTIGQLVVRVGFALEQAQTFAANAAHELRTPLSAVLAELDLLAESPTPLEPESLFKARRKLSDLAVLIEHLLILATPRRTTGDEHEIVSLRDLVEDSIALLPPGDVERLRASEGDALVKGDAVLLATMVANALGNALKFGEQASIDVELEGASAIIRIDDEGAGVDADQRERVFEPFFRAEGVTRRRIPGHGLGLALIRHIARNHGGDAAFANKAGRGARLEIRLPISGDDA